MTRTYEPMPMPRVVEFKHWIDEDQVRVTFRGEFRGAQLAGTRVWRLLSPIDVIVDGSVWFTVPTGFETDLLSTPRFCWVLFDPEDPHWVFSALSHDFLYDSNCPIDCTRTEADSMLREGGKTGGAGWLLRWLVFLGVRVGGRWKWRSAASGIPSGTK